MAQQCSEDVLYGSIMTVQNCVPHWREIPELKAVALKIAERLSSKGWSVELGLSDSNRRFALQPPAEAYGLPSTDHAVSLGRRKAGIIKVGNFYIADRRTDEHD